MELWYPGRKNWTYATLVEKNPDQSTIEQESSGLIFAVFLVSLIYFY